MGVLAGRRRSYHSSSWHRKVLLVVLALTLGSSVALGMVVVRRVSGYYGNRVAAVLDQDYDRLP